MSFQRFLIFPFLFVLASCGTKQTVTGRQFNDTTVVLNAALLQATSVEFMPSASALRRVSKFGDTILLTATALPLEVLPTVSQDNVFKVLSKDDIYRILTGRNYKPDIPNYLCVTRFEKSDTGYYIQIQNLSAFPFGGGGSLGLYFKKEGDSLKIVDKMSGSLN